VSKLIDMFFVIYVIGDRLEHSSLSLALPILQQTSDNGFIN